jgi:cytochrome oxidase assembly protein ShyY1
VGIIRRPGRPEVKQRLALTALGLCLALGFASLGSWQLGREASKRTQLAQAAAALAGPPRPLDVAAAQAGAAPVKVAGRAVFMSSPRLLLDNQRREAQVGVRLYCAAQTGTGPALLVDMGWLPMAPDRSLPAAACPSGEHGLAGLLVPPPSVGLRLGPGLVDQGDGAWLATRLEPAAVSDAWRLSRPLAPRVLRLDPAVPLGHERDLALLANTLPPEKHRGYAIQWFGLAIATFVILLVLNLRKRP